MFITVVVKSPVRLVRRRTGEHVGDPVQEFEDGGENDDFDTVFDMRNVIGQFKPTDIQTNDVTAQLEGAGSVEQLVAATAAFSGNTEDRQHDLEVVKEVQRRAELDRPPELRRVLTSLHEQSMLSRPAKKTFIQHLENGLAKATLRVWRGELTITASVQSYSGGSSHQVRGASSTGTGARLRGDGKLSPDGSIDRLRLDVQLDHLPPLGPIQQAELSRLKNAFVNLYNEGLPASGERNQWSEAHFAMAQRRPEMPLMLLVSLLNDLEKQASGLMSGNKGPPAGMVTLHDLLENAAKDDEPKTQELDLNDQTRLTWVDDQTPALDMPGVPAEKVGAVNEAFRRILAYLPQAWAGRVPITSFAG